VFPDATPVCVYEVPTNPLITVTGLVKDGLELDSTEYVYGDVPPDAEVHDRLTVFGVTLDSDSVGAVSDINLRLLDLAADYRALLPVA
jgi:hypothetical protein